MIAKVAPAGDHILLEFIEKVHPSESPENGPYGHAKYSVAKVIAKGPWCKDYRVGSYVMVHGKAQTLASLRVEGKMVHLIQQDDLLATVTLKGRKKK